MSAIWSAIDEALDSPQMPSDPHPLNLQSRVVAFRPP